MNGLLNLTYCPDAGLQHLRFVQQPPARRPELAGQFLQVSAYHVAQLDTFQVKPYPFVRVQFRSLPGQLLQLYALGRSLRQPLPHRSAAVVGMFLRHHVKFSGHADGAQVVVSQPAPDYRRPGHRPPSPQQGRQQVEPRFVGPQDASSFSYGLFTAIRSAGPTTP